ncbi:hypothetical protein [Polyangium aurulentum]|uniref:hypothetical protein n=1 Tax=Polyangium aurulentum TaxID=2567896 RepID=UPI00146E2BFA|nr:hypothetical protein [Polyangium aurulentum]UQA55627.1 hypothetical protein E8A73_030335 [Polyangium aurulentum]
MRLRLALALSAFPVALASYLVGCSSELPIEDLCGWIGDENNCYRKFAEQIGSTCGTPGQNSAKKGYFYTRDKLDVCVLESGGQVVFDPPLEIGQFPVTTASFAFLDDQANVCGGAAIAPDGALAITISSVPPVPDGGTCEKVESGGGGAGGAGGTGGTGGAGGGGTGGAPPGSVVCGGTFSAKPVTERELFDTTCPSGETHHFNRLQLSKCPEYDQLLPRAELESNPGSIGIDGFVRFRIYYPPTTDSGTPPKDPKKPLADLNPNVVEYFNCVIPGAAATCSNGVQDGNEADIDCGALCPTKCIVGQRCQINLDCRSQVCGLVGGFRQCLANPNCTNMMKDPDEGDEDCGAICDKLCEATKGCNSDDDCVSGTVCANKVCTAPMP